MAAVLVENRVIPLGQSDAVVTGVITLDNSYVTGGEPIDAPGDLGYHDLAISGGSVSGYLAQWDQVNQKLVVWRTGSAVAGVFQEVPNATDLSAVSFRFIALRPA